MADARQNNETAFMSWLSENVSTVQLPELRSALIEIELRARKEKLIKGSLYNNLEISTLKKIEANIKQSKIFRFTRKRQWGHILSALNYLLLYLNRRFAEAVAEKQPQEEVAVESVLSKTALVGKSAGSSESSTDMTATVIVDIPDVVVGEDEPTATPEEELPGREQPARRYYRQDKESFYRWLKENQRMAEGTCRSYVSAIRRAEQFAEEHGFASKKLYTRNAAEAKATADALFATPEFRRYNMDQHNRFGAAITKLLIFFENERSPSEQVPTTRQLEDATADLDMTPYINILMEYFPKGYRLESALDMKRLRRYYEEVTGTAITAEQPKVEADMRKCGIVYDGKLYVPQSMLSSDVRERVLSFVDRCFDEGRSAVYYEALFSKFSDDFLDHQIYNADMLKAYLSHYTGGKYYIGKSYLSKDARLEVDPIDEIRQYFKEQGVLAQIDALCSSLSHIAVDCIKTVLGSNGEFVKNAKGEYFHADSLELTEEELENIAALINASICEHEFISGNELFDAIQIKYPYTYEKNSVFSVIGWRDALKYKFGDRFSFVGNVISRAGTSLSMSDVFADYAKSRRRFTIDELERFAESIGATIYFDALYTNALRINHQMFVSKDIAHFAVKETDAVIERFCTGAYIPLSTITEFATFPDASFPWTEYLLEQYVAFFSEKFYLLHGNYNKNCAVGAIARKTCPFDAFDDLVTDILAQSDVLLQKREALNYLVENGYIARRSYADIESLIINARAKRNQKEK